MEELLQYMWKHKLLPIRQLKTTDFRMLEVLNPGLQNRDSGPDFIGAKIKIDGTEWVGNVEVHIKSSDWYYHHHESNPAYNNVILHVACEIDRDIKSQNGRSIPQLHFPIPNYILDNHNELLTTYTDPRCKHIIQHIPQITIHNWLTALEIERMEMRSQQINERLNHCNRDWETVCMITIMRNFGFGLNGDGFEKLAYSLPMQTLCKHRDNLFQIEALFFGQAGLLDDSMISTSFKHNTLTDTYFQGLKREYAYLRHKFGLTPINPLLWRFLRLRPQNFPHIRIAQLAMMYHEQEINLSKIIASEDIKGIYSLLDVHVSQYWKTHYTFASSESAEVEKSITDKSKALIVINSVAPLLFAYGKYKGMEELCDRALQFLEDIKPESNRYIREWKDAGIECRSAADSQALIHLTRNYCQPHDCLRCRFGYEFIRQTPDFMREDSKNP